MTGFRETYHVVIACSRTEHVSDVLNTHYEYLSDDVLSLSVTVPSKSVKKMNLGFDFIAGSFS